MIRGSRRFPLVVSGNTVGQKVTCKDNEPAFTGGLNIGSEKEGQCF